MVVMTLAAGLVVPALGAPAAQASNGGASAPAQGTSSPLPSSSLTVRPTAIATWFGPGFYGHKTACGQTLTPSVVGVAHRTLPCGTLVKVSWHGHALTVPVLDRGPYANGADWDLTAGAAKALGITETVRIRTRVVGTTANTPTLGSPPLAPSAPAAAASSSAGGTAAG
ncbi:MAG TPA: septal ring lytic transglycosylase RlpA family protein [Solirubrobacteraceae bacterium]|nr:septal ring lytic transglycosylase RlpA family protein [Solirubrobacteraceae bacterium]